jgi:hypothetical protein
MRRKTPPKHSRKVDGVWHVWHVPRLWELSRHLPVKEVEVASFDELDWDCWFGSSRKPTIRTVARHCQRIMNADLSYPIILHADGSLMDGGHRLAKALMQGLKMIKAVQFDVTPPPDEIK